MRGVTTIIALFSLLAAVVIGIRQQLYISCVGQTQVAAAQRTADIAKATDVERRAQRALIANTDHEKTAALRAAALAAYDATDRVRAANPPPPDPHC